MTTFTTLVLALCLIAPSAAWASSDYISSFQPGTYKGHVVSVHPDINDTEATMKLDRRGDEVIAEVTYEDSVERWVWNSKTLKQKEFGKDNKLTQQYTATATDTAKGGSQKFKIDCKNTNDCSTDIDPRHSWVLESKGDSVTYSVFGVSADHWADRDAKAKGRHVLRFTRIDTGIAKTEEK